MSDNSTLGFGVAPTGTDSVIFINSVGGQVVPLLDKGDQPLARIMGGSVSTELGLGDPHSLWLQC